MYKVRINELCYNSLDYTFFSANTTGHKVTFDVCGDDLMLECATSYSKDCNVILQGPQFFFSLNSSQLIQTLMGAQEVTITTQNNSTTSIQTIPIMRSSKFELSGELVQNKTSHNKPLIEVMLNHFSAIAKN